MKTPKPPEETTEQKQQRLRAESDNTRSMQDYLEVKTGIFRRLQSPRISIGNYRNVIARKSIASPVNPKPAVTVTGPLSPRGGGGKSKA